MIQSVPNKFQLKGSTVEVGGYMVVNDICVLKSSIPSTGCCDCIDNTNKLLMTHLPLKKWVRLKFERTLIDHLNDHID